MYTQQAQQFSANLNEFEDWFYSAGLLNSGNLLEQ